MAGNDELIYYIKFQPDDQSYEKTLSKIRELEEAKKEGVGGSEETTQKTIEFKEATEEMNESNQEAIDKLIELQEQIDAYRNTLQEIRNAKKDNNEIGREERETEARTQAALKSTRQEYRDNQKELIASTNATEGQTASYNQLRAETKLLESAMRDVPLDDNTGKLEKMKETVAENKKTMKDFNAEIGDHSMNVGNYSGSLSTLASSLAIVQGPLGPLAGRLNSLNTTMKALRSSTLATADSWKLLKVAMAGTIIGGVVLAIGGLSFALSKIQPVIDRAEKTMAQLGSIFDFVKDKAGALVGANEATVLSLGEVIHTTGQLKEQEQELRDQRIADIPVIAQLEASISELRQKAEDEMFTTEERIKFMEEARKKNKELMDIKTQRARVEEFIAAEAGRLMRNERKDNEAINEAKAKRIRLEGERAMQDRTLLRRQTRIIDELRVEREQREKHIKTIQEESRALAQAHKEAVDRFINDPQLSLSEQRHERMIALLKGSGQQRLAVEMQMNRDIQQAKRESAEMEASLTEGKEEKIATLTEKYIIEGVQKEEAKKMAILKINDQIKDEQIAIRKGLATEIKRIEEDAQNQLDDVLSEEIQVRNNIRDQIQQQRSDDALMQLALEKSLAKGRHEQLAQLDAQEAARRNKLFIENLEAGIGEEEAFLLAQGQAERDFFQKKEDTKSAIQEQALQHRLSMMQAHADLAVGVMNLMFGDSKAVRVATALVDTFAAANASLAQGGQLGFTQAAAAVALGLANVRKIMQTEVGDKPSGSGGQQAGGLSSQMGFEVISNADEGSMARQVAIDTEAMQTESTTNIYLSGDLDKEVMAIKAREGNRQLNTKTLTTKSR